MFIINDIFTKKEFLDIIKNEKIPINSPSLCSKKDLKEFLEHYIVDRKKEDKYKFLKYKDPATLTAKEKEDKMLISKKINAWLSNGYDLERSYYNNINEIIIDAEKIKNYTQYPSILKVISGLNIYLKNNNEKIIQYENLFDIKQELKKLSVNKFSKKEGRFEIVFD
jgi:hypothetical protein